MAFCGQEGLVTDQSQALLVMVCTQEVQVCLDCFTVSYRAASKYSNDTSTCKLLLVLPNRRCLGIVLHALQDAILDGSVKKVKKCICR